MNVGIVMPISAGLRAAENDKVTKIEQKCWEQNLPLPRNEQLDLTILRGQGQVKKYKIILPNNAILHSRHVIRGFRVGVGVTFDRDIHFIIRVHLDQTVKIQKKILCFKNKI